MTNLIKFDIEGFNALLRAYLMLREYPKVYSTLENIDIYKLKKNDATYVLLVELYPNYESFAVSLIAG